MKILITAGPVHAPLDDNKVISNRCRGIWAMRLAESLACQHEVTVVVPDIMSGVFLSDRVRVIKHSGYSNYRDICINSAPVVDAMILAAAVTNYIPKTPFVGKMPTVDEEISIKFVRAPSVINEVRKSNKLMLVGCKLTIGETRQHTVEKAQGVISASRAHLVVANDMSQLNVKLLCFPDGSVHEFDIKSEFGARDMYRMISDIITDRFYSTHTTLDKYEVSDVDLKYMQRLIDVYGGSFHDTFAGAPKSFGSIAIRMENGKVLCTPRKKTQKLSAADCVVMDAEAFNYTVCVHAVDLIQASTNGKATLNAPLLLTMLSQYPGARGVVHLHKDMNFNRVKYAPAGTGRDSHRHIPAPSFMIEGHGSVFCVDKNGDVL